MKYALLFSTALLMAVGQLQPVSAQTPLDLVKQGVEAQGGVNALRALKTLALKYDAKHWEPGQSNSINGEARFLGDSTVTVSVDFVDPVRVRYDWDRDMKYPAVERVKYSEIRYPTYGAVVDEKGRGQADVGHPADSQPARKRPRFAGPAAARHGCPAEPISDRGPEPRQSDAARSRLHPGADQVHHYIRSHDQLPAAVRIRDEDNIWGDSNYDLILSDWRTVGGIKFSYDRDHQTQRHGDRSIRPTRTLLPTPDFARDFRDSRRGQDCREAAGDR